MIKVKPLRYVIEQFILNNQYQSFVDIFKCD